MFSRIDFLALWIWIPMGIVFFLWLPPRRALLANTVVGWLILPVSGLALPGLPDVTKVTVICYGSLLAVLLFDLKTLLKIRWRWLDLFVLVLCIQPFFTSISNQLGPKDGLSAMLSSSLTWGVPYLLARAYFSDFSGIRDLAIALVIGGLAYVPVAWWEMRMSPNLHYYLYGFRADKFVTTARFGGYRPTGFLRHGIEFAMFMSVSALMALWLWRTKTIDRILGMPIAYVAILLLLTALACRSLGAWVLLFGALAAAFCLHSLRLRVLVLIMILAAPTYIGLRCIGWDGQLLVQIAAQIDEDRSRSLNYRLINESMIAGKAITRPAFGWGGWNRFRVYDDAGNQLSTAADGLWIITFGQRGTVGLVAWLGMFLCAGLLLVMRLPARLLIHPALAPATLMSILMAMFITDWLFNGFINPLYTMMAGALVGIVPTAKVARQLRASSMIPSLAPAPIPEPALPVRA